MFIHVYLYYTYNNGSFAINFTKIFLHRVISIFSFLFSPLHIIVKGLYSLYYCGHLQENIDMEESPILNKLQLIQGHQL